MIPLPSVPLPAVIVLVIAFGGFGLYQHGQIVTAKHETTKVEVKFGEYREQAERNAKEATQRAYDLAVVNFRNSERVANAQAERDRKYSSDLSRLAGVIDSLRQQQTTFSAGVTTDTASGDVASLSARATLAGELFEECRARYGQLAEKAERVRVQAVGLYDYIKGNQQCSAPFGSSAASQQ